MALSVLLSGLGVFLKLLCGLVINKVLSTQLGPAAFGVWGNIFSLTTLYTSFANGGIAQGFIAKFSAPGQSDDGRSRWLGAGLVFAFVFPCLITVFHSVARHFDIVGGIRILPTFCVLGLAASAAITLHIQATALAEGRSRLNSIVMSLSGILSLVVYYLIVKPASVESAVYALLTSTCIVMALWLAATRMRGVRWWLKYSRAPELIVALRALAPYVTIAIAPAVLGTASIIGVRETIHAHLGADAAGLWQGLFRISDAVVAVAQATVAYVLLPVIFRNASPRQAFVTYIKSYVGLVIVGCILGMLILFFLSKEIVLFLYSEQFTPIANLLWIEFAGDTLKIIAMPFVMFFIYERRLRISWGLEALFSGSFFLFCNAFVRTGSLSGAALAYVASNLVLLLTAVFLFRRGHDA